jgi:hypothetical protein
MASAVRRLGSLSMARGCARIDAGPDTAKIGSADRVQVHHARLIAVIGYEKRIHTAWVINGPDGPEIRLPLFPRKRTQVGHRAMSVWGQQRT